ncbi:intracellular septation protein [Listeria monocytogenes FSL F2-208]|nr:intracellular septation protein [Listeria monocytogenes FSL F2-208]
MLPAFKNPPVVASFVAPKLPFVSASDKRLLSWSWTIANISFKEINPS